MPHRCVVVCHRQPMMLYRKLALVVAAVVVVVVVVTVVVFSCGACSFGSVAVGSPHEVSTPISAARPKVIVFFMV